LLPAPPICRFNTRSATPRTRATAPIEEGRARGAKRTVFQTRKVERDKPVVIVRRRIVDDPSQVIERYVDVPAGAAC